MEDGEIRRWAGVWEKMCSFPIESIDGVLPAPIAAAVRQNAGTILQGSLIGSFLWIQVCAFASYLLSAFDENVGEAVHDWLDPSGNLSHLISQVSISYSWLLWCSVCFSELISASCNGLLVIESIPSDYWSILLCFDGGVEGGGIGDRESQETADSSSSFPSSFLFGNNTNHENWKNDALIGGWTRYFNSVPVSKTCAVGQFGIAGVVDGDSYRRRPAINRPWFSVCLSTDGVGGRASLGWHSGRHRPPIQRVMDRKRPSERHLKSAMKIGNLMPDALFT